MTTGERSRARAQLDSRYATRRSPRRAGDAALAECENCRPRPRSADRSWPSHERARGPGKRERLLVAVRTEIKQLEGQIELGRRERASLAEASNEARDAASSSSLRGAGLRLATGRRGPSVRRRAAPGSRSSWLRERPRTTAQRRTPRPSGSREAAEALRYSNARRDSREQRWRGGDHPPPLEPRTGSRCRATSAGPRSIGRLRSTDRAVIEVQADRRRHERRQRAA